MKATKHFVLLLCRVRCTVAVYLLMYCNCSCAVHVSSVPRWKTKRAKWLLVVVQDTCTRRRVGHCCMYIALHDRVTTSFITTPRNEAICPSHYGIVGLMWNIDELTLGSLHRTTRNYCRRGPVALHETVVATSERAASRDVMNAKWLVVCWQVPRSW